jgi:hypothetical protein
VWNTNIVDQRVFYSAIKKNGTTILQGRDQSSSTLELASRVAGTVLLLVGDTIEMHVGTSDASSPAVSGDMTQSYLTVEHLTDILS